MQSNTDRTPTTKRHRTISACPNCDHAQIYSREWRAGGQRTDESNRYRCRGCGAEFGDPIQRPRRKPGKQPAGFEQ